MKTYLQQIKAFINDEEGATAVEYGLVVGLISLAIVIGAGALGTALNTMFNSIATYLGSVSVP